MKALFKYIGWHIMVFCACTVLFIAMFHIGFLRGIGVLMYEGIGYLLISGIAGVCLLVVIRKKASFDAKDIFMQFVIFCCVNMVLFTLIPVTVERSVSVFMLSYMEDGTYTKEDIEEAFAEKYVSEYGAFNKRFNEQIVTGSIEETDDGYKLTDRGMFIVSMFRGVSKLFNTDERLVFPHGE